MVGIYQKYRIVGHAVGKLAESLQLIVIGLHPAVGMGPQHGNVVNFSGIYIGGAYAAAYVGGATGRHGTIKSLGAPEAKLHDRSEEHTSELQSRPHLVCRLLLEKKKNLEHFCQYILVPLTAFRQFDSCRTTD